MLKLIKMRIFEIETEEIYSADYFGCVPVSNPADLSDDNASMMERYTDRQMLSMDYLTWCWDMVSSFYCPALSE